MRSSHPGPILLLVAAALLLGAGCAGTDSKACAQETAPSSADDTLSARAPLLAPDVDRMTELFPDAGCSREWAEPFPHLTVHRSDDLLLGYRVDSDPAGTTAEGFVGPVPLRVWFDTAGVVKGVDVLDNEETPGYLDLVLASDLMPRLLGYRAGSGDTVDAVTLATCTSGAIIRGVIATADLLAGLRSGE